MAIWYAVFGLALIFGPAIGGTLSVISYSTPMFLAAGISLLSIIFKKKGKPEDMDVFAKWIYLKIQ